MDLASKLQVIGLRSTFLTENPHRTAALRPFHYPLLPTATSLKVTASVKQPEKISSKLQAVAVETAETETEVKDDVESLFSSNFEAEVDHKRLKQSNIGASSISSGIRLENICKSYKGVTVLKDVSWEVKRGEKVGLVGVNGAEKTTQLRIISVLEELDSGNVIKAKNNTKIAFLSQEFEVAGSRTNEGGVLDLECI